MNAFHSALRAHRENRLPEAARLYQDVLRGEPEHEGALHYLGLLYCQAGQLQAGLPLMRRALEINPDNAEAWNNLGAVLYQSGDFAQAHECFAHIAARAAGDVSAHYHLGTTLLALSKPAQAEAPLRRAVELAPRDAQAHANLGLALQRQGRITEARAALEEALRLEPRLAEAWQTLAVTEENAGRIPEALAAHRRAVELAPHNAQAHSALLLAMHYDPAISREALFAEAKRYGERHGQAKNRLPLPSPRAPGKWRIGYVSPDFRDHPVAYFFESVLRSHNREQFEIYCYSASRHEDAVTVRLKALTQGWRDIASMDDAAAARRIREDGIDLLVDLSGHTGMNRLGIFACRPARAQASWLGYFDTTGMPAMDYLVADRTVIRENEDNFYTEKAFRLPDYFLCLTAPEYDIRISEPPVTKNGFVTFGSFNRLCKLNDVALRLYSEVLHANPGSKLILKAKALTDEGVCKDIRRRFREQGVQSERLLLEGHSPMEEMLRGYGRMDIALDPLPHNGGTVSAQALWCGVPVVTRAGDRWVARMGESMLITIGLPQLVARSNEEYIRIATALASDLPRLKELRAGLRQRVLTSPLTDAKKFTRTLERFFLRMLQEKAAA